MLCARPVIVWIVIAGFVVSNLSVLPTARFVAAVFGGRQNERFPCESCGCGCLTATYCWTNCCCHTPAERLAWAEQHDVTPPTYAVLSRERISSEPPLPACCAARHADHGADDTAEAPVGPIGGKSPFQCRGVSTVVLAAPMHQLWRRAELVAHQRHPKPLAATVVAQRDDRVIDMPTPPPQTGRFG